MNRKVYISTFYHLTELSLELGFMWYSKKDIKIYLLLNG